MSQNGLPRKFIIMCYGENRLSESYDATYEEALISVLSTKKRMVLNQPTMQTSPDSEVIVSLHDLGYRGVFQNMPEEEGRYVVQIVKRSGQKTALLYHVDVSKSKKFKGAKQAKNGFWFANEKTFMGCELVRGGEFKIGTLPKGSHLVTTVYRRKSFLLGLKVSFKQVLGSTTYAAKNEFLEYDKVEEMAYHKMPAISAQQQMVHVTPETVTEKIAKYERLLLVAKQEKSVAVAKVEQLELILTNLKKSQDPAAQADRLNQARELLEELVLN